MSHKWSFGTIWEHFGHKRAENSGKVGGQMVQMWRRVSVTRRYTSVTYFIAPGAI